MIFNIENYFKKNLEGKTFLSSEFVSNGEPFFTVFDAPAEGFNPVGKIIVSANLTERCGDIGLALKFEEYADPLFFYQNENIHVSD